MNTGNRSSAVRILTVMPEGETAFGLHELCDVWCNEQWLAARMTREQAAASVLDCFAGCGSSVRDIGSGVPG
jgi:hypothetical protein